MNKKLNSDIWLERLSKVPESEFKKAYENEWRKPEKMTYIVAEKQFQARHYARHKELHPSEWKYVDREDKLRGVKDIKVVVLAGSHRHTDYHVIREIIDYLVSAKRAELEFIDEW